MPKNVSVTDLSGLYLLPGLIDSHIHLGGSGRGSASPDEYVPARLVRDTQVYLAIGVTTGRLHDRSRRRHGTVTVRRCLRQHDGASPRPDQDLNGQRSLLISVKTILSCMLKVDVQGR